MELNYSNIFDNEGLSYTAYRALIDQLLLEGKSTGTDHSEGYLHYTKMNVQRMNRVEKTTVLNEDLLQVISNLKNTYHILVISEGWCGDAAQILPVIVKMVEVSKGKLDMKIVLRDQNIPLIDAHLTNNGRAIPVVLILNDQKELVMPKWGPRPAIIQELRSQWLAEGVDGDEVGVRLHAWYAKDKTQATQEELKDYLSLLS